MNLKKEYQSLVESVRSIYLAKGKRLKNDDFANKLKYNKSYFGTLVGESGKVTPTHITEFKMAFHDELNGIEKPEAGDPINEDRALIKALFYEIAKMKAEKEGISFDAAVEEIKKNTNLVKTLDLGL